MLADYYAGAYCRGMENETTLSKDLINKAQWVCDLMKQDGVKPEQLTDELCIAYLHTVNRKIEIIQNKLLTDQNAKKEFTSAILTDLA